MSDNRDPAIKLFGRTIALPSPAEDGGGDDTKGSPSKETTTETKDKEEESPNSEEKSEPMTSDADESHKPPSYDQETPPEADSKTEEQLNNDSSSNSQEKQPLKKPDKILPCPRCNSMDTKFCYYNNYNVNQPRHFCKNCQRYWTAGGTMRNVPVGAGRRKNKNSVASHYRHLTKSDSSIPDPIHHPALKPTGTVLSFGSDTPLCESVASVLNLAEKTMKTCNQNGFLRVEEQMEEQSTGSSAPASHSNDEGTGTNLQEPMVSNCQGFAPQVPYLNGTPWPYPWAPPPPPGAAFCGLSYPVPFYPATAYYGCNPWSIPWLSTMPSPSGPNSPSLGKHTREGNVLLKSNESSDKEDGVNQSNQEKCLWVPKTLRIHDTAEAAKSSFWATMGFNNDKADVISGSHGGIFKSFQTKQELNNHKSEASQALHANPAALSRSINFQEST